MTHAIKNKVSIIGVLDNGVDGLTPLALLLIEKADVIIGGARTLSLFEKNIATDAQQYDLAMGLAKVPQWIEAAHADNLTVVVLATGDPLCHGIGRYLINKLGSDTCHVVPNVSTIQLAFSRLGLAWQDAKICSVHSKDAGEWSDESDNKLANKLDISHGLYPLLETLRNHDLVALFTSPENSPDRVARMLSQLGLADMYSLSVVESLLTANEKIRPNLSVMEVAESKFCSPNVVILQRLQIAKNNPVLLGLADETYAQRKPDKGLITKREVRAVSLARLQLHADSIVWDIGAGSGSVGLEAARLCHHGFVYAIEKNQQDYAIAKQNQQQMGVTNYRVQHAKAPALLDSWPDPDAVFFGGSGGELADLIRLCVSRLKPSAMLVMNFVTLENLALATETLKALEIEWDVLQLQASRSKPILHMQRLQAENPVWIVCAQVK